MRRDSTVFWGWYHYLEVFSGTFRTCFFVFFSVWGNPFYFWSPGLFSQVQITQHCLPTKLSFTTALEAWLSYCWAPQMKGFLICLWKVFLWTWDTLEERAVFDIPFLSSGLLCPVPFSCKFTNLLKADGAQMIPLQTEVFRSTESTDATFSRVFVSHLPSFNIYWQTVLFLF